VGDGAAAAVVALIVCNLFGLRNAGRLAGVAVAGTVLIELQEPPWRIALDRFIEVSLGILIALAVSPVVYPPGKRRRETG
jgi:uncharacterized membrane protein YccC